MKSHKVHSFSLLASRIRQGLSRKLVWIKVPRFEHFYKVLDLFIRAGVIASWCINPSDKEELFVWLKYTRVGKSVLFSVKTVSTPGHRRHLDLYNLQAVLFPLSVVHEDCILSTRKGFITGRAASKLRTGGELFYKLSF